ncbi:McrB family protein [Methanocalculus taiwanensis]|nr:AAA family ATPase [Methanocalculus taiwanensis]
MEFFSIFLVMKRMGISVSNPIPDVYLNTESPRQRENFLESLKMTCGLFGPGEKPGKRCCLDPFAFDNTNYLTQSVIYKYNNASTVWNYLPARVKDTIDNTLRDYYFDRDLENNGLKIFSLKQDYLDILTGKHFLDGRKINVYHLAIWVYRFHQFEELENTSQYAQLSFLRDLFYQDFKISEAEINRMFEEEAISITLSSFPITGEQVRDALPDNESEVDYQNYVKYPIPIFEFKDYRLLTKEATMNTDEVYQVLREWNQAILYGPPGTGKSYIAGKVAEKGQEGKPFFKRENVYRIQFHPSFRYEDFIGGTRWDEQKNQPVTKPGPFVEWCKKANQNKDDNYLLIIEEINRGNLSNIFGETIQALDRDYRLKVKPEFEVSEGDFYIPKNLYILGTMNSTDRSIALVDYALRRRFAFIRFNFDKNILEDFFQSEERSPEIILDVKGPEPQNINLVNFAAALNKRIIEHLGTEMVIGHTYFIPPNGEKWRIDEFRRQYNYKILPMLEEYTFGKEGTLNRILGDLNTRFDDDNEFINAIKKYI